LPVLREASWKCAEKPFKLVAICWKAVRVGLGPGEYNLVYGVVLRSSIVRTSPSLMNWVDAYLPGSNRQDPMPGFYCFRFFKVCSDVAEIDLTTVRVQNIIGRNALAIKE